MRLHGQGGGAVLNRLGDIAAERRYWLHKSIEGGKRHTAVRRNVTITVDCGTINIEVLV